MDAAHTSPLPLGGPLPSLAGRSVAFGADDTATSGVNTPNSTHTDPSPASDGHHTSGYAATVDRSASGAPTFASTLSAQLLRLADTARAIAAALPADLKREDAPNAERLVGDALRQLEVRLMEALGQPHLKPNRTKGR